MIITSCRDKLRSPRKRFDMSIAIGRKPLARAEDPLLGTVRARVGSSSGLRSAPLACLLATCTMLSFITLYIAVTSGRSGDWSAFASNFLSQRTGRPRAAERTLVLYVFSNSDPQYMENLIFFLREGVHTDDLCEYIFVVNQDADMTAAELPSLPPNARYVMHANECYDWGTFGWALGTQQVELHRYKHFIFMNSSIRGPFLPLYAKGKVHWSYILTSQISESVKLVGATINCEGSPLGGDVNGEWRRNPHVQSYLVATDYVGLKVLLDDQMIWRCYKSMWDTIYYSELGSSAAILDAGFNIAALMVRYHGVDWRDQSNWGCNGERNPYGENYLDGGSLEAMEVSFVKVKQRLLDQRWSYPVAAANYDRWLAAADAGKPEVLLNTYNDDDAPFKLGGTLAAAAKGPECFDCEYYRTSNPDLPTEFDCAGLFSHYVNNGQFEGREFRFKCDVPARELLPYIPSPTGEDTLPHMSKDRLAELLATATAANATMRNSAPIARRLHTRSAHSSEGGRALHAVPAQRG